MPPRKSTVAASAPKRSSAVAPAPSSSNKKAGAKAAPAPAPAAAAKGKAKKKAEPEPEPEEEDESEDEQYDEEGEDDDEEEEEDEDGEDDEECEGDEEGDESDSDNPLAALASGDIGSLMAMISQMKSQKGPVVTGVLLHANGTTAQVTLDMTPSADAVGKLLGGACTFVGSYPSPLGAVIMTLRDSQRAPVNQHVLAPPYDRDAGQLRGPLLLVRMDDNSTPQNLTTDEYEQFLAQPSAGAADDETEKAPRARGASGKKKGMSTAEAAALAKNKRKSAGGRQEDGEEEAEEMTTKQPAAKKQKKAAGKHAK